MSRKLHRAFWVQYRIIVVVQRVPVAQAGQGQTDRKDEVRPPKGRLSAGSWKSTFGSIRQTTRESIVRGERGTISAHKVQGESRLTAGGLDNIWRPLAALPMAGWVWNWKGQSAVWQRCGSQVVCRGEEGWVSKQVHARRQGGRKTGRRAAVNLG